MLRRIARRKFVESYRPNPNTRFILLRTKSYMTKKAKVVNFFPVSVHPEAATKHKYSFEDCIAAKDILPDNFYWSSGVKRLCFKGSDGKYYKLNPNEFPTQFHNFWELLNATEGIGMLETLDLMKL